LGFGRGKREKKRQEVKKSEIKGKGEGGNQWLKTKKKKAGVRSERKLSHFIKMSEGGAACKERRKGVEGRTKHMGKKRAFARTTLLKGGKVR